MQLRVIPNNKLYYAIKERSQPEIKRVMNPYKDAKIDFLALGFWVSSIFLSEFGGCLVFCSVQIRVDTLAVGNTWHSVRCCSRLGGVHALHLVRRRWASG